ncbi:MAG TPA: polysaccharide deacetylase family protein [Bacteroidales bacterium]|nr:polysaccharide deacetylase family protein [Bacteroidales bacterium]
MTTKVLKIYSPVISPRLSYVADIIFKTVLGLEFELTDDRRKIGGSPAILYCDENITGHFVIKPSGLLSSKGIEPLVPEVHNLGDMPVLFSCEGEPFPFDVFSASFYMLSRYEEYLPFTADSHGRFPGAGSLAYRGGFLRLPVVEIWARYLATALVRHFPVLTIRHNDYHSLLTVDIDQPFAFRGRGFLRTVGGFVKGMTGHAAPPAARFRSMTGKDDDPFDNFKYIEETTSRYGSDLLFFFPTGDRGDYDHNPSHRDHDYIEIIKNYDSHYGSGLHPSYRSSGRLRILNTEAERYRIITGHFPDRVRQHWLLLKMPETYRFFEEAGFSTDYSMGFADEPGFRAGIARPFKFYDLEKERVTGITVVPFQVMDGTLKKYLNLSVGAATETLTELISATKKAGGLFVSVWHNTSLTEQDGWEGWRAVFETMLSGQRG